MDCGHPIRWYDNFPVLSWLLLRGRCCDCNAPISWRYPAVELAVGLWFALAGLQIIYLQLASYNSIGAFSTSRWISEGIGLISFAILGFLLIGLMVMDWQTQRLPDAFTLPGIAIGFALTCVRAIFHAPDQIPSRLILQRIASIAGAALILLVVRWGYKALRNRDGMGLGDVKLLAMIAAFLGFGPTLLALFFGVLAASVYGIFLVARRRASGESRLALGSFLAAGGLFSALFGPQILACYMDMLR